MDDAPATAVTCVCTLGQVPATPGVLATFICSGMAGRVSTMSLLKVMAAALSLVMRIVRVDSPWAATTAGENCLLTDGGVLTTNSALVLSSLRTPSWVVTPPLGMVFT